VVETRSTEMTLSPRDWINARTACIAPSSARVVLMIVSAVLGDRRVDEGLTRLLGQPSQYPELVLSVRHTVLQRSVPAARGAHADNL